MLSVIFSAIAETFRSLSEPSNSSFEASHFDALASVERHEEALATVPDHSSMFDHSSSGIDHSSTGIDHSTMFDHSSSFDHSSMFDHGSSFDSGSSFGSGSSFD